MVVPLKPRYSFARLTVAYALKSHALTKNDEGELTNQCLRYMQAQNIIYIHICM